MRSAAPAQDELMGAVWRGMNADVVCQRSIEHSPPMYGSECSISEQPAGMQ